jgi:flotillin
MESLTFGILATIVVIAIFTTIIALTRRYKKCPSDKILVIYGKVGGKKQDGTNSTSKCIHGGAAFVWPLFQDYEYLELTPISFPVDVPSALSKQNIRLHVSSRFTVGISTEPNVMTNAAERLLGMDQKFIQGQAQDIIVGQFRQVIATMDIEEINANRDKFLTAVQHNVETELKKLGLKLLNVNIVDIKDESGYIEALGKEAASKALNDARKSVAEKDRDGAIGEANANQDRITQVSALNSQAEIGKAEAERIMRVKKAEAHATAVEGENRSQILINESESLKRARLAEVNAMADATEKVQAAKALEESYEAQRKAEMARAAKEKATLEASVIVSSEIEKQQIEIQAEAEAEKVRRRAKGDADAIIAKAKAEAEAIILMKDAEARGIEQILSKQAEGLERLVKAAGSTDAAVQYLMLDKLPTLVATQVEAIKNIKIDKVTVWDSNNGKATPDFLQGVMKSLPPMSDVFTMAGATLPGFLGGKATEAKIEEVKTDSVDETEITTNKKK